MKSGQLLQALSLATLAYARPFPNSKLSSRLRAREVPQELSHFRVLTAVQEFLQLDNPDEIVDPVFGLLGNAAAADGAGLIEDLDCLQQATADQAFTNAKAASDIDGMTNALIFRALERNTGSVGLASELCTSVEAVNPEIAALTQHQDPASEGAAELNKQIALDLAVQIASIGGDPLLAIDSGTFEPGDVNDPTGAGNTCDVEGDEEGCIFSQNLLVPDVTEEEINAAIAEAGLDAGAAADDAALAADACAAVVADDAAAAANATAGVAAATATATATAAAAVETAAAAAGGSSSSVSGADFLNLDMGSCSGALPLILFDVGFDGRDEASFLPADLGFFNHGSAVGVDIITQFICDQLSNSCGASQGVLEACALGQVLAAAANGAAAADAFNSVFLSLL
ncbi:hypothetical protein FQN50_005742 [Emmonsiellopsis sp. PD_5]|nr:hypothetical protein FQN50_005742 [Emmonsiellopsis sp. PD_5]